MFQSPEAIYGGNDSFSSSLSTYAFATFGASVASSDVFPYLPTISTSAEEPAIPTATVMSYAVPIAVTPDGDSDVSRYYDQPFVVDDDGLMSCYDHNGDLSSVDAFACRN